MENPAKPTKVLKTLDDFKKSIEVTALRVPTKSCSEYMRKLPTVLLNQPFSQNVIADKDHPDKRLVLLSQRISKGELKSWIEKEVEGGVEVITHTLSVDHKSYSMEKLIDECLDGVDSALKIDNIDDIKILTLNQKQFENKEFIGNLLLEKSAPITKSIYYEAEKRVDEFSGVFFTDKAYHHLCGEKKSSINIVHQQESQCSFTFDPEEIIYQPAHQQERSRLLTINGSQDRICDLFGDLFHTIILAKNKKCQFEVNCNLNLKKVQAFETSIVKNDLSNLVTVHNLDTLSYLEKAFSQEKSFTHIFIGRVLKNLAFLKTFVGIFNKFKNPAYQDQSANPTIQFYVLLEERDSSTPLKDHLCEEINKVINTSLGNSADLFGKEDIYDLHIIKDAKSDTRIVQCNIRLNSNISYHEKNFFEEIFIAKKPSLGKKVSIEKTSGEELEKETNGQGNGNVSPTKKSKSE